MQEIPMFSGPTMLDGWSEMNLQMIMNSMIRLQQPTLDPNPLWVNIKENQIYYLMVCVHILLIAKKHVKEGASQSILYES